MTDEKILACHIKRQKRMNKIYITTRSVPNKGYELYSYYANELTFDESEFVGLRVSEARDLIMYRVFKCVKS